jgi:hypothetical protein
VIDAVAFALQLCKDFPKIQCCSPLQSACRRTALQIRDIPEPNTGYRAPVTEQGGSRTALLRARLEPG